MTSNPLNQTGVSDVDDLILLYLEGRADEPAVAQLNTALHIDPTTRRRFVTLSLHARCLAEVATPDSPAKPNDVTKETADRSQKTAPLSAAGVPMYRKGCEPQPFKIRPHHFAISAVAAALLIACGLAMYFDVFNAPQPERRDPRALIGPPLAVVVEADAVGWNTPPHATGDELDTREFAIYRGRLGVESLGGTTMELIGPSAARLRSTNEAHLLSGAARFQSMPGFVVSTPNGVRIVDEGTAFDIWVIDDAVTRVQTTTGRVRIERPEAAPYPLDAGMAALADALSERPESIAFDQTPIVRVRLRPRMDETIHAPKAGSESNWFGQHQGVTYLNNPTGTHITSKNEYRKFLRSFTTVRLDTVGDSIRAEFVLAIDRNEIVHGDDRTVALRCGLFDGGDTDAKKDDHGYRLDLRLGLDDRPAAALLMYEPAGPDGVLGGSTFGNKLGEKEFKRIDDGEPHRYVLQLQRTAKGLRSMAWIDGRPVADHTTPTTNDPIRFDRFGLATGNVTGGFHVSPIRVTVGHAQP